MVSGYLSGCPPRGQLDQTTSHPPEGAKLAGACAPRGASAAGFEGPDSCPAAGFLTGKLSAPGTTPASFRSARVIRSCPALDAPTDTRVTGGLPACRRPTTAAIASPDAACGHAERSEPPSQGVVRQRATERDSHQIQAPAAGGAAGAFQSAPERTSGGDVPAWSLEAPMLFQEVS